MELLKLPLSDDAVTHTHANNTLIVNYVKPQEVLKAVRTCVAQLNRQVQIVPLSPYQGKQICSAATPALMSTRRSLTSIPCSADLNDLISHYPGIWYFVVVACKWHASSTRRESRVIFANMQVVWNGNYSCMFVPRRR